MAFCYEITAALVTLLIGIIGFFKWKFTYWEKVGLPVVPPSIPFGNTKDLYIGRLSFGEQFREIYNFFKLKGYRHGGAYMGPSPVYIPVDPEIVKHIMQTDFPHFASHGGYVDEENDPLSGHLFNLDGNKWRELRVKLTPTFTSGKMKMMFQTVTKVSENLKDVIEDTIAKNTPMDVRDVLSCFGTDIISSVAFGLECDSLKNPNVLFRRYGKRAVEFNLKDSIKIFLMVILPPKLLRAMKYKFTKPDVEQFFLKVIKDMVEYREKNNVFRKDFMHLLIQLKNLGTVTDDGQIKDTSGKTKEVSLTMNELAAQAYVFFMAGYETSSTTVTFALYELGCNPDIQDKLREEIHCVLAKHNNELTYEAVMAMKYLDKVLCETLRKYPPLPILTRLCTKDYTVPQTDIHIKKGVGVIIPVLGLQTDPEYYPNPEVFDPDRFSDEAKQSRPPFTWLPFGDGPRICIGMRFGILQSKVALITFLKDYRIKLDERTHKPIRFNKRAFVSKVDGEVWVNFEKL